MWIVLAAVAGVAFGAADQALGSLLPVHWTWQLAEVSAPWLLLPFLIGMLQGTRVRALTAGAVAAVSAVIAYIAMILSPMEGVHLSDPVHQIFSTTASQWPWLVGAVVVAPAYGVLGFRWRAMRSNVSAAVLVATICLEPAARVATGQLQPAALIWQVQVAVGLAVGVGLLVAIMRSRRRLAAADPYRSAI